MWINIYINSALKQVSVVKDYANENSSLPEVLNENNFVLIAPQVVD